MTIVSDTLYVRRTNRRVQDLCQNATRRGHEHNWEGDFIGQRGSAEGITMHVKASIGFHGTLIDGTGRFTGASSELPPEAANIAITGVVGTNDVTFEVWMSAEEAAHEPFSASGTLSDDGSEMHGTWSVRCFNPETCGCGGGGGEFKLKRVE